MAPNTDITQLLVDLGRGQEGAVDRLLPLVYDELHRLARRHRYRWRGQHRVPGTTSLVHEAYLKLVDQDQVDWQCRRQFFYLASRAMRSILVDNARRYQRLKRGDGRRQVPLEDHMMVSKQRSTELLALDAALDRLACEQQRLSRIVECRFFGGLTIDETADTLAISPATVKRGWNVARAWLYHELSYEAPEGAG